MKRTIWKFPFDVDDRVGIDMPKGAKLLAVQLQGDTPCLWAEVDPGAKKESRLFAVFGTGNQMPREMGYSDVYVGTFQEGPFVWHLYELTGV